MAYNSKNKNKRRAFIVKFYAEWKAKNMDRTDTYFVRKVLAEMGHFISYSSFMRSFKHSEKRDKQLDLFKDNDVGIE